MSVQCDSCGAVSVHYFAIPDSDRIECPSCHTKRFCGPGRVMANEPVNRAEFKALQDRVSELERLIASMPEW